MLYMTIAQKSAVAGLQRAVNAMGRTYASYIREMAWDQPDRLMLLNPLTIDGSIEDDDLQRIRIAVLLANDRASLDEDLVQVPKTISYGGIGEATARAKELAIFLARSAKVQPDFSAPNGETDVGPSEPTSPAEVLLTSPKKRTGVYIALGIGALALIGSLIYVTKKVRKG